MMVMDSSDSEAKRTLVAIGEISAVLRNRFVELRRLPEVKSASSAVEIMSCESGPVLEGYLDLELQRRTDSHGYSTHG